MKSIIIGKLKPDQIDNLYMKFLNKQKYIIHDIFYDYPKCRETKFKIDNNIYYAFCISDWLTLPLVLFTTDNYILLNDDEIFLLWNFINNDKNNNI